MIFEYITVRTTDDLEDDLRVIWDFLHEQAQPGTAPVTRSAAVRYAILTTAARIKEQQEQQGGEVTNQPTYPTLTNKKPR